MEAPPAHRLLEVWETSRGLPPHRRDEPLLRLADPGLGSDDIATLGLGARHRLLAGLRQVVFGDELVALVACDRCDVALELNLNMSDLLAAPACPDHLDLDLAGHRLRCRPLAPADLVAASAAPTAEAARAVLVGRAVVEAHRCGRLMVTDELPVEVVAGVAAALGRADPLAAIELAVVCDACDRSFVAALDLTVHLLAELDRWATGVLGQVHTLAWAYGWAEHEILALTPARRAAYLELVAGA